MKSANYNNPSCESGVGNLSADVMSHIFSGAEAVDSVVKLRRMSERNTYARITVIGDATIVALTEVDLGFVSREDGVSDDPVAFADGLILTVPKADVEMPGGFVQIPAKHDIAMTIKVNAAGNDGKVVKFLVEFINTSG